MVVSVAQLLQPQFQLRVNGQLFILTPTVVMKEQLQFVEIQLRENWKTHIVDSFFVYSIE